MQCLIIKSHTYYTPINYWVLNVFSIELHDGETYALLPDGYSYIIYKLEKVSTIAYYKPFITHLVLKSEQESMYYIARCRPTYIGYLMKQKIKMTSENPNDFLISLSSVKFKSITPTVLDNILIHLQSKNEEASLPQLKKQYQCNHLNVDSLFKKNIGITFSQYQNILLNIT